MTQAAIRKALETRLATLAPAWKTVYEDDQYEPDVAVPYQEVALIGAPPQSFGVFTAPVMLNGLFQISICTYKRGGPSVSDVRAAAVQEHFKRGLHLSVDGLTQQLWVPDHPSIGPDFGDATWRRVPVSVPWSVMKGI